MKMLYDRSSRNASTPIRTEQIANAEAFAVRIRIREWNTPQSCFTNVMCVF